MIDVVKAFNKSRDLFLKDPRAWLIPLAGWLILFIVMLLSAQVPKWAHNLILLVLAVPAVILAFGNILVGLGVIRGEMIDYHGAYAFDSRHLNFAVALLLLGLFNMMAVTLGISLLKAAHLLRYRYSGMALSAVIFALVSRFLFVAPLIVDQTTGAVDAIVDVWEKTKGMNWQVYAFQFAFFVAFSLDAKIFHVASVFLIPMQTLMICTLYEQRWLSLQEHA